VGLRKYFLVIYDDHRNFNFAEFFINIQNFAPYFIGDAHPINLVIKCNNSYSFMLPPHIDPENNTVTINAESTLIRTGIKHKVIQSFNLIGNAFEMNIFMNKIELIGKYNVTLDLSDTKNTTRYSFLLEIVNTPPRFSKEKPTKQRIQLG
jgi:hypothetical protein